MKFLTVSINLDYHRMIWWHDEKSTLKGSISIFETVESMKIQMLKWENLDFSRQRSFEFWLVNDMNDCRMYDAMQTAVQFHSTSIKSEQTVTFRDDRSNRKEVCLFTRNTCIASFITSLLSLVEKFGRWFDSWR